MSLHNFFVLSCNQERAYEGNRKTYYTEGDMKLKVQVFWVVMLLRSVSSLILFSWWRAPQQTLRTHRSLEAYCENLWWRLLVFSFFRVMEHRWNDIDTGRLKYSGKKPVPVPLCPPQIPHGLTRDRTRASAVRGRRLTAWTMARPWQTFERIVPPSLWEQARQECYVMLPSRHGVTSRNTRTFNPVKTKRICFT
jgi:hypothetical protein